MSSSINEEACRQVASTLVDNLLAKAIVKASQELAFTHSREFQIHSAANSRRNSQQTAANMVVTSIDINGVNEVSIKLLSHRI